MIDIFSIGSLALSLKAELDRLDIESAHFVGHAIGGMLVQELAAREPARLKSATLFATSPSLGGPDSEVQKNFRAGRLAPVEAGLNMADFAPALMTQLVSPHADPDGVRQAIDHLARVPPDIYRKYVEAAAQFDRRDQIHRLQLPVLCLAGEADRQAPALMMEQMARKMPQGRFALIPRAGHEAHLEQPHIFNALLSAFLNDLETQTS